MPTTLPAPSKALTAGLDFSSHVYLLDEDSIEVFNRDSAEVLEWVRDNLQASIQFSGLQQLALLSLRRGSQHAAPIYIDARKSEVKLLDAAPKDAEPDVVANISPACVLDAITGRLLTQNMFTRHADPPCPGAFASCFAPLGLPGPMTPSSELDHDSLPKPTEDPEQIKRDIKKWGYAYLANALSPKQVEILKTAVLEQAAGERKNGVGHMQGSNQRIWNLPNKGDEFLDMLNHPLLETFAPWFLGEGFQIYNMSANVALRGESGIHMHKDQSSMPPDQIDFSYMLNAIWYLTDLTPEKGATLIYPGSHLKNVQPLGHMSDAGGSIPACAPAGTVLLLDSRAWHSTGDNHTDEPRPLVILTFEVKAKLSDRQKVLLGFPVEGAHGSGYNAYKRKGEEAAEMRAPVSGNLANPN
ncbi:phytanoyl-CoA dioxygenase [Diaporthe sp. PMI_573]|nr:phytanoyl-CoA dioxygenase [Diaporthaceae sp. PMI_573]